PATLVAKTSAGAVAADETDVIAKRQQLFLDRPDQRVMVAARQVGPSDRPLKQHVADMSEPGLAVVEHDMAWRMPRTMKYLELMPGKGHRVAFRQIPVGRAISHIAGQPEARCLIFQIGQQGRIGL